MDCGDMARAAETMTPLLDNKLQPRTIHSALWPFVLAGLAGTAVWCISGVTSWDLTAASALPAAASDWIDRLGLVRTAYGSYLGVSYACSVQVAVPPERFPGGLRPAGSAIYNLYAVQAGAGNDQAADPLHSLASDETWHYYAGDGALDVFELNVTSRIIRTVKLGLCAGCVPQHSVVYPLLVGALLADGSSWALTGASSSPGYDARDSRPTNVSEILRLFPQNATLIERLTAMNPS